MGIPPSTPLRASLSTSPPSSIAERTLSAARRRLLESRVPAGHWEGCLSSSALSTATAVVALDAVRRHGGKDFTDLVRGGLRWLAEHQNPDGGFGDTTDSPSNISTTTLCWAALSLGGPAEAFAKSEAWLTREAGGLTAPSLARAIGRRYGKDRTFSVPILTMCAIAGRLGGGREAWDAIPSLPFELAALPASWYRRLGLTVVSYALPALIAIGQAIHHHAPTRNPLTRLARAATRKKTLRILEAIQPASGGFLEATPLTSFVTMSLAASGQVDHPVTRKAADFLAASARPEGSWAIDTNLATWITTLSVHALGGDLPAAEHQPIREWLLRQQYREVHPYTQAAPGGWAWTDRSGGVPDADDTSGALLALSLLGGADDPDARRAARAGVEWLLDLQNRDGGIPTFCRGWGKLPFDQSCPDITAHAIRAWNAWRPSLPELGARIDESTARAFHYLVRTQRADGSWIPLWFGNQHAPDQTNPVYGTSRVLLCSGLEGGEAWREGVRRAAAWLGSAQNPDGGFGTIEETALALEVLSGEAATRAARWIADRTAEGTRFEPSPIGLYFAKLWYWDRLYPVIFTVGALGRALAGEQNRLSSL